MLLVTFFVLLTIKLFFINKTIHFSIRFDAATKSSSSTGSTWIRRPTRRRPWPWRTPETSSTWPSSTSRTSTKSLRRKFTRSRTRSVHFPTTIRHQGAECFRIDSNQIFFLKRKFAVWFNLNIYYLVLIFSLSNAEKLDAYWNNTTSLTRFEFLVVILQLRMYRAKCFWMFPRLNRTMQNDQNYRIIPNNSK